MLRFSLGNEYLSGEQPAAAVEHLREATRLDEKYSAAWKLLGKALAATDDDTGARQAWEQGIAVAEQQGDRQAAKEMTVFIKRLDKKGKRA